MFTPQPRLDISRGIFCSCGLNVFGRQRNRTDRSLRAVSWTPAAADANQQRVSGTTWLTDAACSLRRRIYTAVATATPGIINETHPVVFRVLQHTPSRCIVYTAGSSSSLNYLPRRSSSSSSYPSFTLLATQLTLDTQYALWNIRLLSGGSIQAITCVNCLKSSSPSRWANQVAECLARK